MSEPNADNDRQQQQQQHQTTAAQKIETIYTTVESEPDRTDWLTVVSNLRQINRQLVEEIARLEQSLAATKQSLHNRKEENQSHEITILQQQDELRIAAERIGAIFQQLETSHQIGQRQQTLIETLSQQLEIVQTVVPQLEAEHEQLTQKYHQQSQKLIKTEQVAVELHRRLQLQTPISQQASAESEQIIDPVSGEILTPPTVNDRSTDLASELNAATHPQPPDRSPLTAAIAKPNISLQIDPAPPKSPLQMPHSPIPRWISSPPTPPAQPAPLKSWREDLASNNIHRSNFEHVPSFTLPSVEITDKESTTVNDPLPNWPAPTLNSDLTTVKTAKIDLPKFPKK